MSMPSKNSLPGVIVLGGHVQGLGILRILGRENIPGIVVDNTGKNLAKHSKFCKAFFCIRDDELLSFLTNPAQVSNFYKWVVFPTNDFHVKLLSYNKIELAKYYLNTIDGWEVIEKFYNKKNTYELAARLRVPIPKTWDITSIDQLTEIKVDFPCIIKPAVMYDFYKKARRKVFICRNPEELASQYEKALTIIPAAEIIIQEVIPGSGKNQYSACFLFLNGQSYVHLTACRMRQHPIDFGNATTYAETVDIPEIKHYAERILTEGNYNGLCEVEFKKDSRDGVYKFLEVNTRTWKWHSIANKAGTPFIKSYFDYLCGKKIKPQESFKPASFMHAATDFPVRFKLLLKGYKFWNRKINPCENAVWSNDDIKPWFFEKLYLINLIINR
jgi:D-aspartate ligase